MINATSSIMIDSPPLSKEVGSRQQQSSLGSIEEIELVAGDIIRVTKKVSHSPSNHNDFEVVYNRNIDVTENLRYQTFYPT